MRRLAPLFACLVLAACTSSTTSTTVPVASTVGTTAVGGTSTTSAGDGGTTPTTVAVSAAIEWTRYDDPEAFDGGFMNAITRGGPGLVAVGDRYEREDAGVWISSDGVTWEAIVSDAFGGVPDDDGVDGEQVMEDVAAVPDLIVAVGTDELQETRDVDAAVWISPDGREWEKVEDEDLGGGGFQGLYAVTHWQGTFYAGGEYRAGESGVLRPGLWRSDDGREWERVEHPLFLSFGATITSLAARGAALVAGGFDDQHENRPVIWITSDGESWDAVRAGEEGATVVGGIAEPEWDGAYSLFLSTVGASPDGWVAMGSIGDPSSGVVWTSQDGLNWDLAAVLDDYDRPGADVFLGSVASTPNGLVAVGTSPLDTSGFPPLSFAQAWVSDDGVDWEQVARSSDSLALEGPTSPWHMGSMHDVAVFGDRLVAVGYIAIADVTEPGDFYDQAVWVGSWSD